MIALKLLIGSQTTPTQQQIVLPPAQVSFSLLPLRVARSPPIIVMSYNAANLAVSGAISLSFAGSLNIGPAGPPRAIYRIFNEARSAAIGGDGEIAAVFTVQTSGGEVDLKIFSDDPRPSLLAAGIRGGGKEITRSTAEAGNPPIIADTVLS